MCGVRRFDQRTARGGLKGGAARRSASNAVSAEDRAASDRETAVSRIGASASLKCGAQCAWRPDS